MKQVFFVISVCFISCQGGSGEVDKAAATGAKASDTAVEKSPEYAEKGFGYQHYAYDAFKDFYRDLFISVMEGNESAFNTFLNPKQGLYIIDSKGAMPAIASVSDISTYKKLTDGKSVLNLGKETVGFEMLEEELPKVNCDTAGFYNKRGCFTASTNEIIGTEIWKHANLSEADQRKFATWAETVSKTCINTANYTWYFSFVDGSWYLAIIDVRRPCEA